MYRTRVPHQHSTPFSSAKWLSQSVDWSIMLMELMMNANSDISLVSSQRVLFENRQTPSLNKFNWHALHAVATEPIQWHEAPRNRKIYFIIEHLFASRQMNVNGKMLSCVSFLILFHRFNRIFHFGLDFVDLIFFAMAKLLSKFWNEMETFDCVETVNRLW